jgi:hypothetical protein
VPEINVVKYLKFEIAVPWSFAKLHEKRPLPTSWCRNKGAVKCIGTTVLANRPSEPLFMSVGSEKKQF